MVDLIHEVAFGRTEWIDSWEVDIQEENTSCIGTIIRTNDSSLPMELVIFVRTCGAVLRVSL